MGFFIEMQFRVGLFNFAKIVRSDWQLVRRGFYFANLTDLVKFDIDPDFWMLGFSGFTLTDC